MKKATYKISIQKGGKESTKEITGYIFKRGGLVFGVDKRYEKHWQVTEISTGRGIGCGIPRLQDAYEFISDEKVEQIRRVLSNISQTLIINDIADYSDL